MLSLRDYQSQAKKEINEYFNNGIQKVLMQMPTGAGKTRVFCSIIHDELKADKNFKCIVVAHTEELIFQIKRELRKYAIETGVIKAGYPRDYFQSVQVASIKTLAGDFKLDGKADMIVIDEAHHTGAPQYQKLFNRFPKAKFLGATATPCRMDGQPLSDFYEKVVLGPSIKNLITRKDLAAVKLYKPLEFLDEINSVKTGVDGDYANDDLAKLLNREPIRAKLVDSYIRYCYGKKGIVYAINRQHAKDICEAYNRHNISAEYIISGNETTEKERIDKVKRFLNGEFKILVNVSIFTEGFDCPDADFIQLARPTKSLILYLQQIGRGLRNNQQKNKQAIILDNAGLTLEHKSFISYEWPWEDIFNNGLDIENEIINAGGSEKENDNFVNDVEKIPEGDEILVSEEFGIEIAEDDPLIEFFSYQLLELYNTIKALRVIRYQGYDSIPVVETIKVLEPEWFDMAIQNKNFYLETLEFYDKLNIDKSSREVELKKMEGILSIYNNNKNKVEIDQIASLLHKNRALDLIQITPEQKEELQKKLQTKYSLPIEMINNLVEGNFDIGRIRVESQGLILEIEEYNAGIKEFEEKLIKIKALAREGKLAREILKDDKSKDLTNVISNEIENIVYDDDLPFEIANKAMFANVLDNLNIKNSVTLKDVFKKLLESSDESFVNNLETLYKNPSDFYKKTGLGPLKIEVCKKIIRLYLLDKGNVNTLVASYFKNEAKEYVFENELKFLQDVLINSDYTSPIVKYILKYYKSRKIFICDNILKTDIEIAKDIDVPESTVRVNATRIDFEELLQDVLKSISNDTKQILIENLYLAESNSIKVSDIKILSNRFNVDFNGRGYALIAREFLNHTGVKYLFDKNFTNLYLFNFSSNQGTIDRIKKFVVELISDKGRIDVSDFNEYEKLLLKTIIESENLIDKVIFGDNNYFFKERISVKFVVEQALHSFKDKENRPNSYDIYDWCKEHYPDMIKTQKGRFASDVLTKINTIKKVGQIRQMSLWWFVEE